MRQTILVTGATGTVGHEVVKVLLEKDVQIKVGVRNVTKIQKESWVSHVEVIVLDYDQPGTLKNALANVDKLFLMTPPGTDKEKEVAQSVLEQAEKQGLPLIFTVINQYRFQVLLAASIASRYFPSQDISIPLNSFIAVSSSGKLRFFFISTATLPSCIVTFPLLQMNFSYNVFAVRCS